MRHILIHKWNIFKYKWSDDINIGTMAQDIEGFMPEAIGEIGYLSETLNK